MNGFQQLTSDLRTLALLNPRLALMLARGQPIAPRSYSLALEWDVVALGTEVNDTFRDNFYQDCWIQNFTYTIRCPSANPGSLFKLMVDSHRKENPYINVEIKVEGPDRFPITDNLQPLENICTTRDNERNLLNRAWVIQKDQNIRIRAVLDRTLGETEIPLTLYLTMNVLELSGCNLRSIGYDEAVCALRKMGIYPTEL